MTTENNLNSYYSHQALKKENVNSSFIKRGPAQGAHSHARLWETSPAGARLGQGCWRWAGAVRAAGALAASRKGAPQPCWASQGTGARPGREGRARDPSQHRHSSRCHVGPREWNAATHVAHNKPNPTFLQHALKKKVKLIGLGFFLNQSPLYSSQC